MREQCGSIRISLDKDTRMNKEENISKLVVHVYPDSPIDIELVCCSSGKYVNVNLSEIDIFYLLKELHRVVDSYKLKDPNEKS